MSLGSFFLPTAVIYGHFHRKFGVQVAFTNNMVLMSCRFILTGCYDGLGR